MGLTRNREGLGPSGETLIAIRVDGAEVRVLKASVPGQPPRWDAVELGGPSDPVFLAMGGGEEGVYREGVFDSEGKRVWAAVRRIPETDWGLVVKIDAAEGEVAALDHRWSLTDVILSLAALAILLGTLMGLRFAKPIHELANAANRIKDGDLSVRAPVTTHDEVGHLARNFNQMAEECIAGTDGYFKRVNPAFERILGWTTDELMSRRFLDFVNPEDLAKTQAEIDRLAQGLPTISFVNRYTCQDGSEKRLAWTAHPEPETGLIYAIARDVTDLTRERQEASDRIEYLKNRLENAEAKLRGDP